eukprot:gnl/TRDRNA2_/TRDRNA2_87562_c3_seq1.p2 gnl/TRDRNA2_/TRDRNA2_87562_c3~~gnl/TRDRNA2_/TRDRNA2_87562_c3_seq1.p2  ORF type:complete len:166 (-),score=29.90 gnl/TRDRNA2_/TRDRNA2_87562_c3_seq1:93-524(-)
MEAWAYIDDDGSGEITEEEWADAIRERLEYFGPVRAIFHILDSDDGKDISIDEFMTLEAYLPEGGKKRPASALGRRASRRTSILTTLASSRRPSKETLSSGGSSGSDWSDEEEGTGSDILERDEESEQSAQVGEAGGTEGETI